jgi:magnesium-transporting ATPase (P-type)
MGIRVKMVTGDQVAIGKEIAGQVGLGTNILDATLFAETSHHQGGRLDEAIEKPDGFAQVFPEHRYHIVAQANEKLRISDATDWHLVLNGLTLHQSVGHSNLQRRIFYGQE